MKTLAWLLASALALRGADAMALWADRDALALASAEPIDDTIIRGPRGLRKRQNRNGGNAQVLLTQNVQAASGKTGQAGNGTPGQVASRTDTANFINFCSGKTKTNGLQVKGGSCNGIVMGDIPATNKMVSTLILFPNPDSNLVENQNFNIQLRTDNLKAGFFTNAAETYYSAPQQVDPQTGTIIGHTHVTVQLIDDASGRPPPAGTFAFFKGINTPANGQGILSAVVTGGLPAGKYRCCTMSSAANHQPVLMPVAQRGAQDDCQRFTVVRRGQGNGNNGNNGNGRNGNGNNQTPPANGGRNGNGNGQAPPAAPPANGNNGNGRTPPANNGNRPGGGRTGGGRTGGGRQGNGGGRAGVREQNTDTPATATDAADQADPTLPPAIDIPSNSTTNSTVVRRYKVPVPEPLYN
ncbi:hypothetical protein Dda_4671 [Drechslerella dactyloides]|uniref:Ribosomal protein s17 n=1 Tax=Drechslerella dactyloides TaxID=74499 RepID=A0AAD6IZK4_DREDA|nr:hypothetical protein Dda_4671 [Drechslerella dactyloides]